MQGDSRLAALRRVLGISTRLRPGETKSVALFFCYAFLLLVCYYVLKTVREPLLLGTAASAEIKSYAYATTALVLLFFIPMYGLLFRRMGTHDLIRAITAFFIANLIALAVIGRAGIDIGFVYYVWVGVFSVTILAQFWAYAADSYNVKSGQRLFPLVMAGATLGGLAGPPIAGILFPVVGPWNLLLASAVLLAATLPFIGRADRAVPEGSRSIYIDSSAPPPSFLSGLAHIKRDRYLLLLAAVAVLLNWINTTGEYVLAEIVVRFADTAVSGDPAAVKGDIIARFYGNYFLTVNAFTVLFQVFLVSRLFRWIGVRGTILILPVVALIGYGLVVFLPIFTIIRAVKVLENSTEYSIFNTARQALFLPLTVAQKYEGKTAIDAFFWRVGDVVQAITIYLGLNWLGFDVENFAGMNIILAIVWLALTIEIGKLFMRKAERVPANAPPEVVHRLEEQIALPGRPLAIQIPHDTFFDPDAGDVLTFTAHRQDGRPLPRWLKFDPATLLLHGQTPVDQTGDTVLSIRATDFEGAKAQCMLVLHHTPPQNDELSHA
jgi:AAA family ATP:ADP antiporter